jgi:DNA helicase-2/ATP-dependent DNA helicase PcrA
VVVGYNIAYGTITPTLDTHSFLDDLNPQQRDAVTAGMGQILVLAGPGSGKTRVLTHRITYLIGAMGVRPHNILALTFTNKAAREMENRVARLLGVKQGDKVEGIWLGTFHAICARLLHREAELLPFTSSFVIYDEDDQEVLIKRAVRDLNLDEKLYKPASVHAAISAAKNNLVYPKEYETRSYRDEVYQRIYTRYQDLLLNCNAVDFDDLLLWAVRLLEENPAVKERYARRFEQVLVDEFQDTNLAQYNLLHALASHHSNLFVVGDEDQSIYRWRGADYRNILRFEEDYPNCQKILLEQNYRSTQTVLNVAQAVIDRNPYRTPKHLHTERGEGEKVSLYEAVDEHAEAAYVADSIQKMIAGRKTTGGEIAVMYRTNTQSRLLEEAFLRLGLPYRLVGAQRFYGRREVKDVIAYLRLVQNPADEVSLARVINVPRRGIGDKTLVALQLAAQQSGSSAGAILEDLGVQGPDSPYAKILKGRGVMLLADFGKLLFDWRSASTEMSLPALFDRILQDIAFHEYIEDESEEGVDRWENVQELRRLAYEYAERGLTPFLETLALVSDQDTLSEGSDAPTLLTLHAAKGLEFGSVFITGLDEGLLPHSRARDDPEQMAEERRLLYVGITRARNRLYLVRAGRRSTFGSFEVSASSRFLEDIPGDQLQGSGSAYQRSSRAVPRWEQTSSQSWGNGGTRLASTLPPVDKRNAPPAEVQYQPSMRVRHAVWGEGMVLKSAIRDGEEEVDVFFESVGFKRVLASIAHLEVIASAK